MARMVEGDGNGKGSVWATGCCRTMNGADVPGDRAVPCGGRAGAGPNAPERKARAHTPQEVIAKVGGLDPIDKYDVPGISRNQAGDTSGAETT